MPFRMERRTTGKASLAPTHPSQRRETTQQHAVFTSDQGEAPGAFAISRQNYRHQNQNEDPDWDPTYQEPTLATEEEEPDSTVMSMAGDTLLSMGNYDDTTTVAEVTVAGSSKSILRRKWRVRAVLASVMLLVLGIILAIALGMKGSSGEGDDSELGSRGYISCSDLYPHTESSDIENYGVLVAELGIDPPPIMSCKPVNEGLLFVSQDYNNLSTLSRLDRFVLATLYASASASKNGRKWRDSTGWMTGAAACDWYGVSCRDGVVTGINLEFNNLAGTLPPEIGRLTSLELLNLAENELEGNIPTSIESMTNLMLLDLQLNRFEGSPLNFLVRMPWLVTLALSLNPISGTIPREIGSMTALTAFHCTHNKITGEIPKTIGEISTLTSLRLGDNSINGTLPASLFEMENLEALRISSTELTGTILPTSIYRMTSLTELSLGLNIFMSGTIPSEIGLLTRLTAIELFSQMELTGTIPETMAKLTDLSFLSMVETGLTGTMPIGICDNIDDREEINAPCGVDCNHCCSTDGVCGPVQQYGTTPNYDG